MMRADYHLHTNFSFDSESPLIAQIQAAIDHGLTEICLTDHYEPPYPGLPLWQADLAARTKALQKPEIACLLEKITVRQGVEVGLLDIPGYREEISRLVARHHLDFVIASCHMCQGEDPYYPQFFDGYTRSQGFTRYLEELVHLVRTMDDFSVVGHIDYPSKGCPYADKMLRYHDAPDAIDSLFSYVIDQGKGIEINTSIFRALGEDKLDLVWLKRYRELGGEIITIGSDAHDPAPVGYGWDSAVRFLKQAGFSYVATFQQMKPIFHKLP